MSAATMRAEVLAAARLVIDAWQEAIHARVVFQAAVVDNQDPNETGRAVLNMIDKVNAVFRHRPLASFGPMLDVGGMLAGLKQMGDADNDLDGLAGLDRICDALMPADQVRYLMSATGGGL